MFLGFGGDKEFDVKGYIDASFNTYPAVTPAAVHRVDSTRMNMGNEIVNRFRRVVLGRQPR